MTLYTASIIAILQDVQGQIEDNSKGLIEELSKAIEQLKTLDNEYEHQLRNDLKIISESFYFGDVEQFTPSISEELTAKTKALEKLEYILKDRIKDLDGK